MFSLTPPTSFSWTQAPDQTPPDPHVLHIFLASDHSEVLREARAVLEAQARDPGGRGGYQYRFNFWVTDPELDPRDASGEERRKRVV